MNLNEVNLEFLNDIPISIAQKPSLGVFFFEGYPTAIVKDYQENSVKIILSSEVIKILKNTKGILNVQIKNPEQEKFEFLEDTTRLITKNLKVIEKPEQEFEIKLLSSNNKKLIRKKFKVPRRIWIIKQDKKTATKIFAIEEWKNEETILYHMPFPNTYPDGKICFGINSPHKKKVTAEQLDKIYFEETAFTYDNNRIVYQDKEKTYTATEFLKMFSQVPNYKNLKRVGTLGEVLQSI